MAGHQEPFNLNAVEREGDPGPFVFTFGDPEREYEMIDPQALDWKDLVSVIQVADGRAGLDGVTNAVSKILGDDAEVFWENKIPAFKLNALLEGYLTHYEMIPAGKAPGSSASSRGTARPSKRTSRSAA